MCWRAWLSILLIPGTALALPPNTGNGGTTHHLEPVVVTASREPMPADRAPGTVSVITREEIERAHYTSLVDVLRRVPGIHIEQPGSRGGRASIYTRGLDPNQTLILLDGVRLNDPANNRGGSFDLSTLDPAGVERIEIVRGPTSAVHGSDAIAGVVNIITRTGADGQELSLQASGGRWGVYRIAGEARARRGPADLSLAGAWVDEGDPPDDQRFRGGNLKAAAGFDLPGEARLRGTLRFADSESRAYPDDSGGPEFATIRALERRDVRDVNLHVELSQAPIRWIDYAASFSYRHRRERRDAPGVAPGLRDPFGIPAESSRDVLDYYAFSLRNTVYRDREVGSSDGELFPGEPFAVPTSFDLDRVVGGAFAELLWSCMCGLALYAGARVDFPDSASAEFNPRVSARYRIPRLDLELSGSWGEGFKLPAFFSLAHPVVGNPGLDPERSQGFDLGVSRSFWEGRIEARASYFDIEVKDLIDFDAGPPPLLVNRSKIESRGFELELRVDPVSWLGLTGSVTHTATDIKGSSANLLNRPRWQGHLTLVWNPLPSVTVRTAALFVGSVKDSSIPTGPVTLDSWTRVDLSAAWRLNEHITVFLEIDNLLDSDYEEAIGFPAPGIRPRAGVQWRL
ncbi:MAG: TonB-dependent receptor [Deltaproteobacteria bacterium]|nr:TonB-dependent receptor [Deltaproteobacteria bacterium]